MILRLCFQYFPLHLLDGVSILIILKNTFIILAILYNFTLELFNRKFLNILKKRPFYSFRPITNLWVLLYINHIDCNNFLKFNDMYLWISYMVHCTFVNQNICKNKIFLTLRNSIFSYHGLVVPKYSYIRVTILCKVWSWSTLKYTQINP